MQKSLENWTLVAQGLLAVLITWSLCACESTVLRLANGGVRAPDTTVVYAADRALALDVYRARPATKDGGAPVVVFFYGGAWTHGRRGQYRFVGQRLAANGVVAIVPDYRTYPAARFPAFMEDAADAVAWARSHAREFGGNPDRIFVAGHSAGAQIAALLGTDAHYLLQRGLAPSRLAGVIGLSGPYDFDVGTQYAPIFGPPSQWPAAQAVNFVDGDEPPFLLIQGEADGTVAPRNSIELATKFRSWNIPVTLRLLPRAGHVSTLAGLYSVRSTPEVLPAMLRFIRAGEPSLVDRPLP